MAVKECKKCRRRGRLNRTESFFQVENAAEFKGFKVASSLS